MTENGTSTELATACAGALRYPGVQDVAYTFTLVATDKVSNNDTITATATPNGITKYYYSGTSRVAMRSGDAVFYLHGDHLGSTSLTTDESGALVSETRYDPYGEERFETGSATTDFTFTGQRAERGFGLYDYNARYYSPQLGRFISPDSIVPDPTGSGGSSRISVSDHSHV